MRSDSELEQLMQGLELDWVERKEHVSDEFIAKKRVQKQKPPLRLESKERLPICALSQASVVVGETCWFHQLLQKMFLGLEAGTTTAGRLDVRIVELKARSFERFDIIYFHTIQVEHARLVDENLQTTEIIGFVEHSRRVFECHGIRKSRATATDYRYPEAGWLGLLRSQNFVNFYGRAFC